MSILGRPYLNILPNDPPLFSDAKPETHIRHGYYPRLYKFHEKNETIASSLNKND
jgi:hypothetical protein